jgi:hypothetical protein
MKKSVIIISLCLILTSFVLKGQEDSFVKYFFEGGIAKFNPEMKDLQKYLQENGLNQLNPGYLFTSKWGVYFFEDEKTKIARISGHLFSTWNAKINDPLDKVTLGWYCILIGVNGDLYLIPKSRLTPFISGGFGMYVTSLDINGRDVGTVGVDLDVSTGLELDIIRNHIFLRLEIGYQYDLPGSKFQAVDLVDIQKTGAGTTYYYQITDELNVKERICGPFYGLRLGFLFGKGKW